VKTKRTIRELNAARFYAAEGLSMKRAAALIGITRDQLASMARVNKVKFRGGKGGGTWGNKNRLGKRYSTRTQEEKRRLNRERVRKRRAEQLQFITGRTAGWPRDANGRFSCHSEG
jgi:hypothetical protein